MGCYCYETENYFIYCIERAKGKIYEKLQADQYWTKIDGDKFVKRYSTDTSWNDAWHMVPEYKEAIINNFARLGRLGLKEYSNGKMYYFYSLKCSPKTKLSGG